MADYETAVGPNISYYLPRFEQFDAGGSKVGWHWPAFFFTTPWFLYRKMWLVGILNVFYPFALLIFCGIVSVSLANSFEAHRWIFGVIFLFLWAAPWFLLPMFASALYWRHVGGLIDNMPRAFAQNPDKKLARLEQGGGTGMGLMIAICAGLGFGLTFIVGMLAAIAIPSYQDYTIRAQVSNGLQMAGPVKVQVAAYWAQNRRWPDQADLGDVMPSGEYVRSVGVASGSVVITYGRAANPNLDGQRLILLPGIDTRGEIVWTCGDASPAPGVKTPDGPYGSDLPSKYLPSSCREGGSAR